MGRCQFGRAYLWASLAAIALVWAAPLSSQLAPDRFQSWRTLRSEHFQIHYPSGREAYARLTAQICERVHAELEPRYRSGASNTHVVLIFESDLVNAFATPFGIDQMVLFMENPRAGEFSRYDRWLELLIRHEYVHILTLRQWDFDRPILALFRILLGFPPNFLSPPAMIEGVAVYEESRQGGGRVNDPLTRMVVRSALLEDRFPSLTELMLGSVRWPLGRTYYLYGGRFVDFLSRQYGHDLMPRYWARDRVPLDVDEGLAPQLNAARGYSEYHEAERTEFEAELARIEAAGASEYERLTFDGFEKDFLYLGADGLPRFFATPPDRIAGLYVYKGPGEVERVRRTGSALGFSEARDGRRVDSRLRYFTGPLGFRHELFESGGLLGSRRLLPGRSAAFPQLSADGQTLLFVDRRADQRRLQVMERNAAGQWDGERTLLETPLSGFIQYLALSPEGDRVAAVVRYGASGPGAIVLCKIESASCAKLVGGPGVKAHPRFSEDGQSVLFASDVDGIYNLYSVSVDSVSVDSVSVDSVSVDSGAVRRLTRMRTGAFYPTPSSDGLYALVYSADGYDLVRFAPDRLLAEPVDYFEASVPEDVAEVFGDEALPPGWSEHGYNSVFALRPYLLGLLGPLSALNLAVAARDPLFRHSLLAAVGPGRPDPVVAGVYDYSRYIFGLSLSYAGNYGKSDRAGGCLNEDDPLRFLCDDPYPRFEEGRGYLRLRALGDYISAQWMAGYVHRKLRNARRIRSEEYDARDLNLSGPSMVLMLGDLHYYPQSISAEHGWLFFASGDYYLPSESFDRLDPKSRHGIEYGIVEGGVALYLPSFFAHHVNYLNAYGYASIGPDREIQKVPLNRFVRGLDYSKAPRDTGAAVFTYEYRLPLAELHDALFKNTPSVRLNQLGAHLFYDVGQSFDRTLYRNRWTPAYGAALTMRFDVFWLSLSEIKLSYARGTGPAGEGRWSLAFNAEFGGTVVGQDERRSPLEKNYWRGIPERRNAPAYFRDSHAGGVFE